MGAAGHHGPHHLVHVQHYNLPIITVVFNNGTLGMVRQWQNLIYHKRFSETTLDRGPDFVKLAEAYGLRGKRVTNRQEMEEAMREALSCGCGYVIDCMLDMDEMTGLPKGTDEKIINNFHSILK